MLWTGLQERVLKEHYRVYGNKVFILSKQSARFQKTFYGLFSKSFQGIKSRGTQILQKVFLESKRFRIKRILLNQNYFFQSIKRIWPRYIKKIISFKYFLESKYFFSFIRMSDQGSKPMRFGTF